MIRTLEDFLETLQMSKPLSGLFLILYFDNFVLSTELIIRIDRCKELLKLAF